MRRTWVVVIGAVVLVLPFLGVDDYYLHLLIMAGLFYLLAMAGVFHQPREVGLCLVHTHAHHPRDHSILS
jgi:hypothetical protein